jgi:hypothetical protein
MYPLDEAQAAEVRSYTQQLQARVEEAAAAALKDLSPALLSFGRGEAEFGVNRRVKKGSQYVISVNPEGPVDHEVPVLKVAKPDGSLRAVLFSYACHNTTLGADNYRIHGDYAGVAQKELENRYPGATALFFLGCAADTNPNPRGTMELVRNHGERLALTVADTLKGPLRPLGGNLRSAYDHVDLPFSPPPSREALQKRLEDKDVYVQRHAKNLLAEMNQKGSLPTQYSYPISVIQFGKDLTLVALAGEVVVDYTIRLRKELPPAGKLWVGGYANDVFAYIASKRVIQEGGYEAETSMIYYGQPGPWAPEAEEVLVGKVRSMVKKLR